MAAKFTLGPWHVEDNYIVAGAVRVAVVDTPEIHGGVDYPEADANACLIAESPDMLDALRHARAYLRSKNFDPAMRNAVAFVIEAAIARATGETK